MYIFKLAFRNIFRNLRRSLLTSITIIFGIFGFIASVSMVKGIESSMIRVEIKTETAHLRIMKKGYLKEEENSPLDQNVQNARKVEQAFQKRWPNSITIPRIIFTAQIGDGIHSLNVRGIAINAKKLEKAFNFSKYTTHKKAIKDGSNVLYMGVNLAKVFGKKAGDQITLLARTKAGSLNALDFKIFDTLTTGNMLIDEFTIFIPLETGRKLLQMPKNLTDLIVQLPSKYQSETAAAMVQKLSPQNHPQTWQKKTSAIMEMNQVRRKIFTIMILIILAIGAIGMANTILMSGFERKGEIGMMTAMGLPTSKVVQLFAIEAGIIGFFASIIGSALGAILSIYYQTHGIDVSAKMEGFGNSTSDIAIASTIYLEFVPYTLIVGVIIGTLVAVLAAIWPAIKTTRVEPREIMAGS